MKTLTMNQKIAASIVAIMLLIYGIHGANPVQAQGNAPELTPVSDRTQQVQDAIVELVPGVDAANDVTAAHLALITNLNLSNQNITALKAGDFDGLSALNSLDLGSNKLSSLSAEIFSGLPAMKRLNLAYNSLDNLSAGTFSGMSALTGLDLANNELSSLPGEIFSGLSLLNWLSLSSNQLSSLPDGLFSGLSSLNSLYLSDNTVDLSITVSLKKVSGNQFKATTATGAPFNIMLPVTVTNGGLDGGVTTITIPAASIESGLLTVIPTPGTSDAVIVDIGTLPALPTTHFGYSLNKPSDDDAPLSFALGIPKPTGDPNINHAPVFTEGIATTRSIAENTPAGRNIGGPVTATDEDEEDVLVYTLSGADAASFGIVGTSGQLQTRDPLDYEKKNTYAVTVTVSDGSATDAISVTIDVTDVEENNAPVFVEGSNTTRTIAENTPAGRNIGGPVTATDEDEEDVLTYTLSGVDAASFGIVSATGQLQTRDPLDYEEKNTYAVIVSVSDGKGGSDTIGVAINVTDVAENNAPVFVEGSNTTRTVAENTPAGRNIGAPVTATDEDEDILTYTLSGVDAASFGIVSATGQLQTRDPLDYEQKNVYSVAVIVSDGNGGSDAIGVAINVTDIDETPTAHAPEFIEGSSTERAIAENTPAGRNIGAPVTATDEDEDVLTYTLSGVDAASFGIVSATGQLQTRDPLDYEQKNVYSVAVIVSDGTLTDTIGVAINVTDVAENRALVFASRSTERSIPENTPAGRNIGSPITATDAGGDTLTYTLDGTDASSFGIVSTTGQLRTLAPLDYEEKNAYTVTVIASDGTLTDTISVAIKITDIDENTPPVFASSSTTRSIPENTPAGVHIGEAISAKDADAGDTLTYTLSGTDAASFDINSTTGQLKTKAALDYETKNTYSVTVKAADKTLTDTIRVTIAIIDVDESSSPTFTGNRTTRFVKENTPAGENVGSPVSATDKDDDALTYTLSGDPDAAAFSIVRTTGQLKTLAPLDFEKKNAYTVTVTVSDGGRTDAITVAITIIDVDETPPTVDGSPQPTPGQSFGGLPEGAVARLGRKGRILEIAYSPSGKLLAVASDTGIWLYDADSGQELNLLRGHRDIVLSVSFSPDGQTLASGSSDNTLGLWDVQTGALKRRFLGHRDIVLSVSFSPDGQTLASGSDDSTVRLWDVQTGAEKQTLRGHTYWGVNSLSFSPDGQTLASGGDDSTVRLWDVQTGAEKQTLRGHTYWVNSVSFSPDGQTLASGSEDSTARLWDVQTGVEKQILTLPSIPVFSVAFSPDGQTLASAPYGHVRLWDVQTGAQRQHLIGHTDRVYSVVFSPDGQTLASGGADGTVRLWDRLWGVETAVEKKKIIDPSGHTGDVFSVSFSPDGQTLASGSSDNTVRLWDVLTGTEKKTLKGHRGDVFSVSFSPDGQTLASGSSDNTVRLWDVLTGTEKKTLTGHVNDVLSVSFSPDGQTLASGSSDNTVRLWDVLTGTEKKTLTGHVNDVRSVSFSPDGQTLASASYGRVRLWDVQTGTEKKTLTGHVNDVLSVSFSPDGQTLASGSEDDTVRLWDVQTGLKQILTGHTDSVFSVSFSPDGQTLASGSKDDTVRLWDIQTGTEKKTLRGHTDGVFSVSFSPDGQTLASGSEDDIVLLWRVIPTNTLPSITSAATVSLAPASVPFPAIGEQLNFSLKITGGQNVAGYQATVRFDDTALRYVESSNSDYLPDGAFFAPPVVEKNLVKLNAASLAGEANGDGTLATLTFEVVAAKPSILTLYNVLLTNRAGATSTPQVETAEITEPTRLKADVNGDRTVNIADLVLVASNLGKTGQNAADVNGDRIVNIADLVLVAGALGTSAAAPSLHPDALEMLTATEVKQWLSEAQQLGLTDAMSQRGILFLQQLLAKLTPKETILLANYPNPFNPETWIPYHLAKDADVTLHIYAVNGTLVRTLTLGHQPAGMYQNRSRAAYWDGKNEFGEKVASGLYFYTLTAGDFSATRKLLIRK